MSRDREEVCDVCGTYGRHEECDARARLWQEEEQARLREFAINGKFGPQSSSPFLSLEEASERLATDIGKRHEFDADRVIENVRWWFIPHDGIALIGFVVDKRTGAVTNLGSGLGRLSTALKLYDSGQLGRGSPDGGKE